MTVIDVGHASVMLPLAGAIAAWLIAGRAGKLALCWCGMFGAGLAVVALSKIAFLGWNTEIPSIEFQALSGHAFRAAAVIPVVLFLVTQGRSPRWRTNAVLAGIAASAALAALLVRFKFHGASEVVASIILGWTVSLGFMRIAAATPAPRFGRWSVPAGLFVMIAIWSLTPFPLNQRLVDAALYLSGRDHPYAWMRHWER